MSSNATDEKKPEQEEEQVPSYGGMVRINKEYGRGLRCIQILSIVGSIVNGTIFPLWGALFSELTNTLFDEDNIKEESIRVMIMFMIVGAAGFVFTLMQFGFCGLFGSKVGVAVREDYFKALLRQEVGYYDIKNSGAINTKMIADCLFISEGMGIKLGLVIQNISAFLTGFTLAFLFSWEMSLVLLACLPAMVVVGAIQGKFFAGQGEGSDPFEKAGAFTNEVLVSIRSVQASPLLLASKEKEYDDMLAKVFPIARRRAMAIGFGIGALLFGMFAIMYSVGLWYGSRLVDRKIIEVGDMFGCFFSFLIAGMSVGQLASVLEDIQKCNMAANRLYHLLAREPEIKKSDIDPPITKQESLQGNITFADVSFSYPSAKETIVLENVSFKIESGKTLALVGPSGSGKSTIVSLLQRFYDPVSGNVMVDNEQIHNYDLKYLRSQIGYVSQIPLLFAESIKENIRAGRQDITDDDIINASKFADAHDFIMKLPDQYETNCGEMGGRLSGGQRQRIAIARALVSKPSILLLDEATSALDTKSEREVQRAIDNISNSKSQTIVVIAHRLSTVKNADKILVCVDGSIEERGTHHELIDKNGVYAALVRSQQLVQFNKGEDNDEDNGDGHMEGDNNAATGDDATTGDKVEEEAPPAYEED